MDFSGGSVLPYPETNNMLWPSVYGIKNTRSIAYRAKVLGRALLGARTDAEPLDHFIWECQSYFFVEWLDDRLLLLPLPPLLLQMLLLSLLLLCLL
jgi:hypothetical protein